MWDEGEGRVTQAFDEWRLIDSDIRAYVRVGLRISREFYDATWNGLATSPADPDGPELPDLFAAAVEGLWPNDFEWMYLAGALKDAVTAFEVYLEKAAQEALRHHGKDFANKERAPLWRTIIEVWAALGVNIEPAAIRRIRELRHLLTHRRGELRTDVLRQQYAKPDEPLQWLVALDEEGVFAAMDELGGAVRAADAIAYEYAWRGTPLPPALGGC